MQPLVLSVGRMIVVYIPLALLLEESLGYVGIFLATAVCNVLLGVVGFFWVRSFLAAQVTSFKRRASANQPAAVAGSVAAQR